MKESGTNPIKTEVDVAIEQIIALEESADEQHDLEDGKKNDKMEGDRLKAEECVGLLWKQWGKHQRESPRRGRAKQRNAEEVGVKRRVS